MLSGHKRGLTSIMKRELKRRSAIEPMIGHGKCDGRLGRNWLLGPEGDKINALLAAAGHNLSLILRTPALLFARILGAVVRIPAAGAGTWAVSAGQSVFADTCLGPGRPATSMA